MHKGSSKAAQGKEPNDSGVPGPTKVTDVVVIKIWVHCIGYPSSTSTSPRKWSQCHLEERVYSGGNGLHLDVELGKSCSRCSCCANQSSSSAVVCSSTTSFGMDRIISSSSWGIMCPLSCLNKADMPKTAAAGQNCKFGANFVVAVAHA